MNPHVLQESTDVRKKKNTFVNLLVLPLFTPREARIGSQMPLPSRGWSFSQIGAAMCMLGIKPRSLAIQLSILNQTCLIYLPSPFVFYFTCDKKHKIFHLSNFWCVNDSCIVVQKISTFYHENLKLKSQTTPLFSFQLYFFVSAHLSTLHSISKWNYTVFVPLWLAYFT